MSLGKALTSRGIDQRLSLWLGSYVIRRLQNGTPILGNRMVRDEHVQSRFQEKRNNSFHVSPTPKPTVPWVIVADGPKARFFNTVTQELSEPMTRAEALQRFQELH